MVVQYYYTFRHICAIFKEFIHTSRLKLAGSARRWCLFQ